MKKAWFAFACVLVGALLLVNASSSATYDSWSDLDADGDIDIFDIVKIAGAYGTMGDPAKNVTISGHANRLAYTVTTTVAASGFFYSGFISVDGYAKVTVCLYSNAADNTYRLETRSHGGFIFYVDSRSDISTDLVQTYDVPNEEIQIVFFNGDTGARAFNLDVYLIP